LFDLLQALRRRRGTVSGGELARELDVSLRTIRRDVATLQAMGADIDGEPGVGYILRPGFLLPPLSFTEEELHALVIGAQWVSRQTDEGLARAVQDALAKINSVLAPDMRRAMDDSAFFVSRSEGAASGVDLARIRQALREQRKMRVTCADETDPPMEQTVWPIMLGFIENQRFVAGWSEQTLDFRLFRTDRIVKVDFLAEHYTPNRRQLVKAWRAGGEHPCNQRDCS